MRLTKKLIMTNYVIYQFNKLFSFIKKSSGKLFRSNNVGWLFVLPALLFMCYFVVYPIVNNFILSMQDVTVMTLASPDRPFVGLDNYIKIFNDTILQTAIINTLRFTFFSLIFQFIIGFLLAVFFNQKTTISKPVRGILMIPWMIPITITALMFRFMFSTNVGIINQMLLAIGIISAPIEWLVSTDTAMFALIVTNIWIGIPFNMILLSTGLTIIPKEIYESASVDGANKVCAFFRITVPLMRPVIESVLILGFIYTFKVFDLVYVMTGGGPVNSTHLLSTYSYRLSFELFRYSEGAAVANILFFILFIVSLFYLWFASDNKET